MRKVFVIGIGNRMMKDDRIGISVTEFLKKNLKRENLQIVVGETDAEYCLSFIREGDFLIIIDSTHSQVGPGSITVLPLERALLNRNKTYSQHEMSLFDLILLHYGKMEGYLIGIEVYEIGFGLELSEELEPKFQTICNDVRHIIEKILEGL